MDEHNLVGIPGTNTTNYNSHYTNRLPCTPITKTLSSTAKLKRREAAFNTTSRARPESAGVLGVGDGEVAADEPEWPSPGGARLRCVGLCGPWAPGSDTRFIASICSLFSPIRLFA